MPPLADQLRRLIGALHSSFSDDALRPAQARVRAPHRVPIAGGGLYGRGLDPSIAGTVIARRPGMATPLYEDDRQSPAFWQLVRGPVDVGTPVLGWRAWVTSHDEAAHKCVSLHARPWPECRVASLDVLTESPLQRGQNTQHCVGRGAARPTTARLYVRPVPPTAAI
jgi:hypothetical protein